MALPGIEKARNAARDAQEQRDIADLALTNHLAKLVADCTSDAGMRPLTYDEHQSIRSLSETLTLWEDKTKRLWDQVAFMEDT